MPRHASRTAPAARTRAAPPPNDVRVGPLVCIPDLLAERGIDPAPVLRDAGLEPALFAHPEHRVGFPALGDLLQRCATLTACAHFGLLVGQRFRVDALGLLGTLMRNAPTLRDALRLAALNLELHDRGAVSLTLDLGESRAALGYSLIGGDTPGAEHILDGATAIEHVLLRELCGPAFRPEVVQLSRRRPAALSPYRRHFGAPLEFNARLSAIVFAARWLDHRIAGASPAAFAAALAAAEGPSGMQRLSFAENARRAVFATILTGSASTASLARLFGLNERTLRRRLAAEGVTVRALVGDVRDSLARHLLRDTNLAMSEIAAALGYAEQTAFARAFRLRTRSTPRAWRQRHAQPR